MDSVASVGTTASNFHVLVDGDRAETQQQVAAALTALSLVSPPRAGWVSVFPADESLGSPGEAPAVSARLDRPCVSFYCFDSDLAMATLWASGRGVDQLAIAWPGLWEEMGFPPPSGEPIAGLGSSLEVAGDIDLWIRTLGRGARAKATAAIAADPECPFADGVAAAVLGTFGLDPNRLTMAFRHYESGEQPEESATFLRVGS